MDFIRTCDTALFGRITYDLFADFWPTAANDTNLSAEDRTIAKALNEMKKIVITKSSFNPTWQNTSVWTGIQADKIQQLKTEHGANIVIYGSGTIVKQLTELGLIDEYKFMIAPTILGSGRSLFADLHKMNLNLRETRTFKNGNVLLSYTPSTA